MVEARRSASALLLVALFVLTVALTLFAALSTRWLPEAVTNHGRGIDTTIYYILVTTLAFFVVGHSFLALFVWKFSRTEGSVAGSPSPRLEWRLAIWAIVLMCAVTEGGVIVVGTPAWWELYGEVPDDALEIEVVGKQFEWLVRYSGPDGKFGRTDPEKVHDANNPIGLVRSDPAAKDDIVKRGTLSVPLNRATVLRLRSLDVLHSFTIPAFRTKQDIVPGFTARTLFRPLKTGKFEIACAELCGLGHYRMRGYLTVETEEDFQKWLSEQEPWF